MTKDRVAIVGAGAAGLAAAYALKDTHEVVLCEGRGRLGGHANTVDVQTEHGPIAVDTGFIVYNERNYPNFTPFLEALNIETIRADMSFAFSAPGACEWSSNGAGVFADRWSAVSPAHLRMIADIVRFSLRARRDKGQPFLEEVTLGEYLKTGRYGSRLVSNYILPMGAAIWSSSETAMEDYPAAAFVRFFDNHRLLHAKRPKWRTVKGGSRSYVLRVGELMGPGRLRLGAKAVSARRDDLGVTVTFDDGETLRCDELILACHSDQALEILDDADPLERALLSDVGYAPNVAVLHSDASLMPSNSKAWAACNYKVDEDGGPAMVTYWMNALQSLPDHTPLFVTLNPTREPDPALTHARFDYDHPQFTQAAMAAQKVFNQVQGPRRTWFAGAWLGYGFHEDGVRAGLRAALQIGGRIPWDFVEGDIDGGPFGKRPALDYKAAAE